MMFTAFLDEPSHISCNMGYIVGSYENHFELTLLSNDSYYVWCSTSTKF